MILMKVTSSVDFPALNYGKPVCCESGVKASVGERYFPILSSRSRKTVILSLGVVPDLRSLDRRSSGPVWAVLQSLTYNLHVP